MNRKSIITGILLVSISTSAMAQHAKLMQASNVQIDTSQSMPDISNFNDLSKQTFLKMSEDAQSRYAKQWGMSVANFKKYLAIKANSPAGALYGDKQLDPNILLAIHALNYKQVQEAQVYVDQAVRNEHKQITSLLKVQNMYQKSAQRLYPLETPIGLKGVKPASYVSYGNAFGGININKAVVAGAKYVLLINAKEPDEAIRNTLHKAINNILFEDKTRIDVYDLNSAKPKDIFTWASSMGIAPQIVNSGRVTLNDSKEFVNLIEKRMGREFMGDTLLRDVEGHYQVIQLSEAAK